MMKNRTNVQSIGIDEERYMAFRGLIQWTQAVVLQAEQVTTASQKLKKHTGGLGEKSEVSNLVYSSRCQEHYFIIAAYKLMEYRTWVKI
jgi:hypothetical protein